MSVQTAPQASSSSAKPAVSTTGCESPVNLLKWVEENRDSFRPPVGNKYLYDGKDFFVMVIAGPNARNDFHVVNSEEYFYQVKGDIVVRTRVGEKVVDHRVREGETFFIPKMVPHCPMRPPNTLGVVVERTRHAGETEHIVFYCEGCGSLVEDIEFDCKDIVDHFRDTMEAFWKDDARRVCKKCGKRVEKPGPLERI